MQRLMIEDGLLLTDMELTTDMAESIGIDAEENDMIYRISGVGGSEFVYSKKIDSIKIGERAAVNFPLEIGAMNYGFDLNGIIGLDLLQQIKAIININQLTLEFD